MKEKIDNPFFIENGQGNDFIKVLKDSLNKDVLTYTSKKNTSFKSIKKALKQMEEDKKKSLQIELLERKKNLEEIELNKQKIKIKNNLKNIIYSKFNTYSEKNYENKDMDKKLNKLTIDDEIKTYSTKSKFDF